MSELNIPESWAEARFEDAISIQGGSQPPKSLFINEPREDYVRLVQIRDFRTDNHPTYIPVEKAKRSFTKNDVMIGRYGPPVFQVLRGLEGSYNVALMKATPTLALEREYMYWFLKNPNIYRDVNSVAQRSAGQTGVNLAFLNEYPVPVPPIAEQNRIVEKIKLCFNKIDTTEQNLNKAESLLLKYRESLLVKAFRGELLRQDSNIEPASVLREKIRIEREKDITGKKKNQEFTPVSDDEKPFDVPESWEWVRLGELVKFRRGHNPPKSEFIYEPRKEYVRFVQIQDFKRDDKAVYVPDSHKLKRCVKGDIMVCAYRHIGKYSREMEGAFNVALCHFGIREHVSSDFIELLLPTMFIKGALLAVSERSMIPSMSVDVAAQLVIPLPPEYMQKKLIETLHRNYKNIETTVKDIQKKKVFLKKLKESILSKAFQGELVDQIHSEGTGKELLERVIALIRQEKAKKKVSKKKITKKKASKKTTKK